MTDHEWLLREIVGGRSEVLRRPDFSGNITIQFVSGDYDSVARCSSWCHRARADSRSFTQEFQKLATVVRKNLGRKDVQRLAFRDGQYVAIEDSP